MDVVKKVVVVSLLAVSGYILLDIFCPFVLLVLFSMFVYTVLND